MGKLWEILKLMKEIKQRIEIYEGLHEQEFLNAIVGMPQKGIETPIKEHCTHCRAVRQKGRCINNECKYYDKTS